MKRIPWLVCATCICLRGAADTVTLNPLADTTISENGAAQANGGSGQMIVGHLDPQHANVMARGLLRFDLNGLPAGAIVSSAALRITVQVNASANTDVHALHRLNAPWDETTATWIASGFGAWEEAGGDFQAGADSMVSLPPGVGTFTFLSVPAMVNTVQGWITTPSSNYGWILRSQSEAGGRSGRRIASREAGSDHPALVLEYTVPNPPSTIDITHPRLANGKFVFDFAAAAGFSYVVQYKAALQPGGWTELATYSDPMADTTITVEDSLTTTNRFYRVIVP